MWRTPGKKPGAQLNKGKENGAQQRLQEMGGFVLREVQGSGSHGPGQGNWILGSGMPPFGQMKQKGTSFVLA